MKIKITIKTENRMMSGMAAGSSGSFVGIWIGTREECGKF